MIAPERKPGTSTGAVKLSEPIAALELDEEHTPAQILADLYRRCGREGGSPYSLDQLLQVLTALRYHGTALAVAEDMARYAGMPAAAVYGCVLELEDYGLARWLPEPVLRADYVTAEITAAGMRFLREIKTQGGRY